MNKILKFPNGEGLHWTADPHLNHARDFVWGARGYASAEEHREGWIKAINDKVKPEDILFLLGDMFLNSTPEMVDDALSRINCQTLYYIFGNHENPLQRIHRELSQKIAGEGSEVYPLRYKNVVFLGNYAQIYVGRQPIIMAHYPLRSWNDMKYGGWMLHGHEHCQVEESKPEWAEGKILDVGWEEFKSPLSFYELELLMANKRIKKEGHH